MIGATFLVNVMACAIAAVLATLDRSATPDSCENLMMRSLRRSDQRDTVTFTKPFDQQHCACPAPAMPDASFARTRIRYSPGSLNVAVVVARPSAPGFGAAGSNVTEPGP